ncbi:2-oxo acid dehydrogenase subunit E2 [Aliiroseovarius sp. S2029]|uniref:dihydrolipoamide acetyltransferase family protein n=1 Tax=Aliiroseovarius sp. S2029 TaxID=2936988 RepID=UPI0020C13B4A|nr:dihydrolipoamide acetyltransferase family protein [Aliiroseovarius sp. S2029]MCK8483934.1 2-oxo acid dehydrogenase subunit E2 [Aliiroseovarius sp. S2029]
MTLFLMPSLGSDMTAGTLVEQTIAVGEAFHRGDVIAAVETQKGVIEVEVYEDGILDQWLVEVGAKVPVGAPLAQLRKEGEPETKTPEIPAAPAPASPEPLGEPAPAPLDTDPVSDRKTRPVARPPAPRPSSLARRRITPAARRFAAQHGVDLASIDGAKGQTVALKDVEAVLTSGTASPPGTTDRSSEAETGMRAAIASAMSRSKREIPHYYLTHQVNLENVDAYLKAVNADRTPEDRLLAGAVYARAVAVALQKFPELNGHYSDNGFQPSDAVHLGIAIRIRSGGLVAPAIFDTDTKSTDQVMQDLGDLVSRVRKGRFKARELSEATVTLTSLGERGVDQVVGVIYPPQVAIIGIGTPRFAPTVNEGQIVPGRVATLSLAADHRVSDGHRGAMFLQAVTANLQEPDTL